MSMRIIHADTVSDEECLDLAIFINKLPKTSVLREALAEMLDTLSHGKNVYMFFYPAGTVVEPDADFDSDGGA